MHIVRHKTREAHVVGALRFTRPAGLAGRMPRAAEVERAHQIALSEERRGHGLDDGVIVAAAQGGVGVGDDGGVFAPGWSVRVGGEGGWMVDSAVEKRGVVVDARDGEGEGGWWEHNGRGVGFVCVLRRTMMMVCPSSSARGWVAFSGYA